MDPDNTLLNATIGAVATFGLSFTAVSPVLGGALAAYLEGGEHSSGLRIGTLSGLIASIPVGVVLLVGLLFVLGVGAGGGVALLVRGTLLVVGYVVGLSALGGIIGIYVRTEL